MVTKVLLSMFLFATHTAVAKDSPLLYSPNTLGSDLKNFSKLVYPDRRSTFIGLSSAYEGNSNSPTVYFITLNVTKNLMENVGSQYANEQVKTLKPIIEHLEKPDYHNLDDAEKRTASSFLVELLLALHRSSVEFNDLSSNEPLLLTIDPNRLSIMSSNILLDHLRSLIDHKYTLANGIHTREWAYISPADVKLLDSNGKPTRYKLFMDCIFNQIHFVGNSLVQLIP